MTRTLTSRTPSQRQVREFLIQRQRVLTDISLEHLRRMLKKDIRFRRGAQSGARVSTC